MTTPQLGAAARPSGTDLVYARMEARITPAQAAALVGCDPTTWRRQERGLSRVDLGWYRLMRVLAGEMPWSGWEGWSVVGGALYAPEDPYRGWTPQTLRAAPWRFQVAREACSVAKSGWVTPCRGAQISRQSASRPPAGRGSAPTAALVARPLPAPGAPATGGAGAASSCAGASSSADSP